jgi:hypothetical protein
MIQNVTRSVTLAASHRLCTNIFSRGLGLMFRRKMLPTVLAFAEEHPAAIHTFFVRHALDVLFLNDRWEVVDLVQGLKPWRTYLPASKAMFVVELPAGTIERSKTALGDVVNFK